MFYDLIGNELFNAEMAVINYFSNKPILIEKSMLIESGRIEEGNEKRGLKNLQEYTLNVIKELKPYIKEHPNFLMEDTNDKEVAKKVTSQLIIKATKQIQEF